MKKTLAFFSFAICIAAILLLQGCPCPKSPDPIIAFLEDGGFAIVPGAVNNADSVTIFSTDADGTPLDTVKIASGESFDFIYGANAKRPIRLKLAYSNASGKTILDDFVSVFDTGGNPGGPLITIDVVVSKKLNQAASTQPCPATNPIATGSGEAIVSWLPNDWFEVFLTQADGTEKRVGIKLEASPIPSSSGMARIFLGDTIACMDKPLCNDTDPKTLMIIAAADTFYVSGTDNNDGSSPRTLKVKNLSNRTIKVHKKQ